MTPGINRAKTWVLIAGLMGLFLLIGNAIGGQRGMTIALVMGLGFNLAMYWFSGSIAVKTTRSRPVTEAEAPELYRIVRELANENRMPMPEIYVSDMMQPNAFATGRNPENAKVAVTRGILQILDERELRGVLAHELSHVANRDILIGSIAAGIGTAISYLAQFALFFGGDDEEGANPLFMLLAWLVAPLAAAVIQMAVSRSREFQADESGPRGARERLAEAGADVAAGAGAGERLTRRGAPVHREPDGFPARSRDVAVVLDAPADGRAGGQAGRDSRAAPRRLPDRGNAVRRVKRRRPATPATRCPRRISCVATAAPRRPRSRSRRGYPATRRGRHRSCRHLRSHRWRWERASGRCRG
jgi:heat shock protein HtpX